MYSVGRRPMPPRDIIFIERFQEWNEYTCR